MLQLEEPQPQDPGGGVRSVCAQVNVLIILVNAHTIYTWRGYNGIIYKLVA